MRIITKIGYDARRIWRAPDMTRAESTQMNLYKAKSKDFYNLLNVKIHTEDQTGPKRWSEKLSLKKDVWTKIFKSLKNICMETKLKEFQFKLIHGTIVT